MQPVDRIACALLAVGSLQMVGALTGQPAVRALAAATVVSPAPKVFSAVRGLETYSTRFFLEWTDEQGAVHTLPLTPETYGRLHGPYNRRNVYGAALAYGPVLMTTPRMRPLLAAVLEYGLCGSAPVLAELGIDPAAVRWPLVLRLEPLPGTDIGDLPTAIEVPLPR